MAVVLPQTDDPVRSEAAAKSSRSLVRPTGVLRRSGCRNFGVSTTPVRDGLGHLRAGESPLRGPGTGNQPHHACGHPRRDAERSQPGRFRGEFAANRQRPPTGSLNENSSLSFSTANGNAISITDAAAGTNADSLTLAVSQGTLTLASTTGLSFTAGANGSSSFTVSGTVTNLDSALDGLVYQPTTLYSGADSLAVSVSDPTDSLSAATSVSITVAALNCAGDFCSGDLCSGKRLSQREWLVDIRKREQ